MKITAKLYPHQIVMRDYALKLFREGNSNVPLDAPDGAFCWWYAGCRTGKTLASLAVAAELHVKRILVLTKKAAIEAAWLDDIQKFVTGVDYIMFGKKVLTPEGKAKGLSNAQKKARFMLKRLKEAVKPVIVVVNYETARIMAEKLTKADFDVVIADESQALKSHNSKQSKALARYLVDVPHKLIMTGTGWDDRITDVYGQTRFLSPLIRPRTVISSHFGTWHGFFNRHVNYFLHEGVKIPKKKGTYKNQEVIEETLSDFTLVIDSREVLDLPAEEHIQVNLHMPKKMADLYKEFEEEMIAFTDDRLVIADNVLAKLLRLHQIASGYIPDLANDKQPIPLFSVHQNPKLQALADIVDDIGQAPFVVFTRFKYDVKMIQELFDKLGVPHKQLTGDKHEHIEWQAGEGQALIANIQAGGTGISLNRARYCIYFSVGYSRTDYEQSLWRIRAQLDPTLPISYWHICMLNTVDIDIQNALEAKGDMSTELLEGLVNRLAQ